MLRIARLCTILLIGSASGCSSLGLSLWPAQMPMLPKAKEFAAQTPIPNGVEHELAKEALTEYFVEPGDRLLIEPFSLDSDFALVGEQAIMVDGSIDLGEFGRIKVAGLTIEAIEEVIADRLRSTGAKDARVNVQLSEANASQFYVLGAVGSPGSYDLKGRETVLDAIVLAGGLTSSASPCHMILVRPTGNCQRRVVLPVCYRQITQLGDATTNYQLRPGDRLVVAGRTFWEELAFWKQSHPCPKCDRSNGVNCQPSALPFTSRFLPTGFSILPAGPKPETAVGPANMPVDTPNTELIELSSLPNNFATERMPRASAGFVQPAHPTQFGNL